jgi:sensor histidine kinase YesM
MGYFVAPVPAFISLARLPPRISYFCHYCKRMSSKRLVNILLHVLFTSLIVMVPIFLIPLKEAAAGKPSNNTATIIFTFLQTAACYTSAYFLYPRFLLRKKFGMYLLFTLLIALAIALSTTFITNSLKEMPLSLFIAHFITKLFIGLFVMGTGTAYRFVMEVMKQESRQREGMAMELSFLRSQVSPHFMFNTLNSMVALARKKSDKLEPALIELSNLMHYMLYESDQEKVNLSKEIDYIQSYIDLQTLRFGHNVRIAFKVNEPLPADPCIEPMLLIPLIENAFKHGIGLIEDPEIDIQLQVEKERILLSVRNKYNVTTQETKDRTSGIGLVNLERRLKLLYPHKHILDIAPNGAYFKASLKLDIHDQVSRC